MSLNWRILGFTLGLLSISGGAIAQSTDEPTPNTTQEGLNLGEVVELGPKVGERYIRDVFDDWSMRCLKVAQGEDPCQMYQLLRDAEGNSTAEFTLYQLKSAGQAVAGATVITPLETLLTAQVAIAVDGSPTKQYPFSFCNKIGCVARLGLTADDVAAYKRGARAVLIIVPAATPDQPLQINISLKGFTAAYNASSPQ